MPKEEMVTAREAAADFKLVGLAEKRV